MTKRELFNDIHEFDCMNNSSIYGLVHDIVDRTIDYCKSQTCSNCNWYHTEVCCNDSSPLCADFVDENYGCNLWEQVKEK
jgi:hypothetical protein